MPAGPIPHRRATEAEAKALASAVRLRILRLCLDTALTNKEIAERLGANPATVLHHVRTLVDNGFLAAQPPRRGARGSRERPYLATRKSWRLDTGDTDTTVGGSAVVQAFLAESRDIDMAGTMLVRLGLRLTDDELADMRGRLWAVIEEYAERPPSTEGRPYSLFLALHDDRTRPAPT
jgi:DNA-binding transcriptional ArsR family regulator